MDIVCSSLRELIQKAEERGCPYYPQTHFMNDGSMMESALVWYAGNDILVLDPNGGTTVNIDTNAIKDQIMAELNLNQPEPDPETEEYEVVSETYYQGYKYQLVKKEITNDEFKRSRRKTIKRKRSSKNGNHAGDERRIS